MRVIITYYGRQVLISPVKAKVVSFQPSDCRVKVRQILPSIVILDSENLLRLTKRVGAFRIRHQLVGRYAGTLFCDEKRQRCDELHECEDQAGNGDKCSTIRLQSILTLIFKLDCRTIDVLVKEPRPRLL